MRARLARIAAVGAITAVVAAKICQRDKNLARVADGSRMVLLFPGSGRCQQFGKNAVIATQEPQRNVRGKFCPVVDFA